MQNDKPSIAVIGGTGDLGSGLARLWAAAGYQVFVGSRSESKADETAKGLSSQLGADVHGDSNGGAAKRRRHCRLMCCRNDHRCLDCY